MMGNPGRSRRSWLMSCTPSMPSTLVLLIARSQIDHLGVFIGHDNVPARRGGLRPCTHCEPWSPGDIREWQAAEGLHLYLQDTPIPKVTLKLGHCPGSRGR